MTVLWRPSHQRVRATKLADFLSSHGLYSSEHDLDYASAHRWSIEEPEAFWRSLWRYTGVIGEAGEAVVAETGDMPSARFFPEARLNFAENLLRRRGDDDAIIAESESGEIRRLSWDQLHADTAAFASFLRACGLAPGDRVAAILPNVPETVVAMLGSASVGAVFSSVSPDFGADGIVDRFGPIAPRVLVVCDSYDHGGKQYDVRARMADVLKRLPGVEQVVVVSASGYGNPELALRWDDMLAAQRGADHNFVQLPFDHPLYIVFSSGTTGLPKCIVHRAGGVLLQHLKEHQLHCDIHAGDRICYYTTCGWMMWNWLVSGLASAATLCLYDGSPLSPDGLRLFEVSERHDLSFLGLSAKLLDSLRKSGLRPADCCDLASLRTIASTGSPLSAEGFRYVYDAVHTNVQLASISGGTDLLACFVAGNPAGPVRAGEIAVPALGMAVAVFGDDGEPVTEEAGELVCERAFPSQPLGFWDDPDGSRYRSAYFEQFPGAWCHGDLVIETRHGGYIVLGRSDAVLNPGGVRIGTAEIYRQVETFDEVQECVAVGQSWDGDTRVVLFVVLRASQHLTDELEQQICQRLRERASPRHVPAVIAAVPDIPRTRSGKITEIAVRETIHGRPVRNVQALENPEALEHFRNRADLLS